MAQTIGTREKIMAALAALDGKLNVTKTKIARKAGVSQSAITNAITDGDSELKEAIANLLGPSVKEKVLFAINYFKGKGMKADARKVARKACVSFGSLYYVAKHSPLIRKGLWELKPISSLDKILEAIRQLKLEHCPLSRKTICIRSGVSVRMYNKLKKNNPVIDEHLASGSIPRNAEGRIRKAVKFLSRRDDVVPTRKMICHFAKVDKTTLSRLENNPDKMVKVLVNEILSLSSDQKIEMAIRSLDLKGQPLDYKHLAVQSGLTLRTIYNRMKANPKLAERYKLAKKMRIQRQQSITMRDTY